MPSLAADFFVAVYLLVNSILQTASPKANLTYPAFEIGKPVFAGAVANPATEVRKAGPVNVGLRTAPSLGQVWAKAGQKLLALPRKVDPVASVAISCWRPRGEFLADREVGDCYLSCWA